ncbi:dihydroorotase [Lunatimonas salinarum]|uniref:dihydroorotase n=1 Tax=Lunatimonas salinarum TaxID=1774590 RepID=UPI001AE0BE6C|nr:dihydroorotase [Lunatimonas salinarum]
MQKIFQSLRIISDKSILPPADYLFDGQDIKEFPHGAELPAGAEVLDCDGLLGSKGWVDLRCFVGEPGLESRETFESLEAGLVSGGFCEAVILPNTHPVIQSVNEVAFVQHRAKALFPTIHLQAAVTKDTQGEDFTEMIDLYHQGVRIFGEGLLPLANADRMMKALQYLKKFDGVLFDHSYDPLLALFGQMHEGNTSTLLGLKGIPRLSEETAIDRNLSILEYTGGRMHFQALSTVGGVEKIRKAKAMGLQVTADTSIYQLIFDAEDLIDFDTAYKVVPPFRDEADRLALVDGLKDGTIDALISNHVPQDVDAKFMEFDLAPFGMIGLQTFLPAMVYLEQVLGWPLLIQKLTAGPRQVLRLPVDQFDTLTVFDPSHVWEYHVGNNVSVSQNSPWLGKSLKGQVRFMVNKGRFLKLYE